MIAQAVNFMNFLNRPKQFIIPIYQRTYFMFQLNDQEIDSMASQNAIPSRKHLGGYNPYVFTEQGVTMLSTVLNSDRAIEVNIQIRREPEK